LNLKLWKDLIDVIGFVAIVASLIFVGMELRQSRAIAIGDGNLSNAEVEIETNNAINAYSAIWTSGNNGETLSDQDTVIFHNLVKNKAIHAFMEYARLNQLEFHAAAESVSAQFSIFLFENPGARQVWLQQEQFLEERFELSGTGRPAWKRKTQANLARLDRDTAR
jgi:hypothetical protein